MLFNSVDASDYPNQKITINLNPLPEPINNARVGIRFNYFYFGLDGFFNLKNSYSNTDGVIDSNSYILSSFNNGNLLSAKTPTAFLNVDEFNPIEWQVANEHEYLFLNYMGNTSAITIWPSHPYPLITKTSNTTFTVSAGITNALGFESEEEFTTDKFRRYIKNNNFDDIVWFENLLNSTAGNHHADEIVRIENKVHSTNDNFTQEFYSPSIKPNIFPKSFRMVFPTLTAESQPTVTRFGKGWLRYGPPVPIIEDVITNFNFDYRVVNEETEKNFYIPSNNISLSTLSLEDLTNYIPYTTDTKAYINPSTGEVNIKFNDPFWIEENLDITISYAASARYLGTSEGFTITNLGGAGDSYFEVEASDALGPASSGIYLFDYTFENFANTKEAFTVSFVPSSFITTSSTSSVNIKTIMADNYYQTSYDIDCPPQALQKRFVEPTNDLSLTAQDLNSNILYTRGEWMPASADIIFYNDGNANKHSVFMQLSSFTGSFYNNQPEPIQFLLNKQNVLFVPTITESGNTSASVNTVVFPEPNEEFGVKWSANPPENVTFETLGGSALSADVFYTNLYQVNVKNLGVDKTEIILYSEEYETSSSTFWYPPTSVSNNMVLEISGRVEDRIKNGYLDLSAVCRLNGRRYKVPTDANITWNITNKDSRGDLTFKNAQGLTLSEGTVYVSDNDNSIIKAEVSAIPVFENPSFLNFDISCDLFNSTYSLKAENTFLYEQFPAEDLLIIHSASTVGTRTIESTAQRTQTLTESASMILSAYYPELSVDTENIIWNVDTSENINVSGTGINFNFDMSALSAQVTLSALSGTPFEGNFGYYNFSESINLYVLSTLSAIDYIAFPENNYLPPKTIGSTSVDFSVCNVDYDNTVFSGFNESVGLSAFKSCHTENIYLSATPGFDKYVWKIGNITHTSTSNKTVVPTTYENVSANGNIFLSAYNIYFPETDPVTIWNTVSSDNSSKFKEELTFFDFPVPTASISIENTLFNIGKYSETPTVQAELQSDVTIIDYDLSLVLSGTDGLQFSPVNDINNKFDKLLRITLDSTDFTIKENSFNEMNTFLSGDVVFGIEGFDFCPTTSTISSNVVPITAYNGPNLNLYATSNVVSSEEPVFFRNTSNSNFDGFTDVNFINFIFDDGAGTSFYTNDASFSASYTEYGSKTPSLTGILSNGETRTIALSNMIFVKSISSEYDPTLTREFNKEVSLPKTLDDMMLNPNDWQHYDVINTKLQNIKTNLDYLSSVSFINNINFPKSENGYLGTRYGNFKWHFINSATDFQNDILNETKDVIPVSDSIIAISENKIKIISSEETPSLDATISKLGNSETLDNPIKIEYVSESERLYILDSDKKILYVSQFDIDNPSITNPTHYWGGVGAKEDRTKLNDPVDMCLDTDKNLYILDSDSKNIKIYNKNLNWIRTINLDEYFSESLTNISYAFNKLSICSENGKIIFISPFGEYLSERTIRNANKCVLNPIEYGIYYALTNNSVMKYMLNDTFVSEKTYTDEPLDIRFVNNHLWIIFPRFIQKATDFIEVDSIIDPNETLSGFSWNSIFLTDKEFVQDFTFNDSFRKIYNNINLLNSRLNKKIQINTDQYGNVISQSTSNYSASAIANPPEIIGVNEPVVLDVINNRIESIYNNLNELKDNINLLSFIPYSNLLKWTWNYHYAGDVQYPSDDANPLSWEELSSTQIPQSTALSTISSWCSIKQNLGGGNHSAICFDYQHTKCQGYFPMSWEELQCENIGNCQEVPVFTWEDLQKNCCKSPEIIFEDCSIIC